MQMTRRNVLEGAALLAGTVVAARVTADSQGVREARAAAPERLSQELFEAYVRMRGSLDERIVYERVSGWTYAMVPGERGRVLWRLDGFSVSRFKRISSEQYSGRTRYFGALRDPQSNELLRVFVNPYTAEHSEVPLSTYGPLTIYLTPSGVDHRADAPAQPARQPMRLGEWISFTDHVLSDAASSLQPDFDVVTYSARVLDAFDKKLASAHSTSAFSATERWRDWMKMGERPGGLFWHVLGAKVHREDVPADLWALAQSVWGNEIENL